MHITKETFSENVSTEKAAPSGSVHFTVSLIAMYLYMDAMQSSWSSNVCISICIRVRLILVIFKSMRQSDL